MKIIKKYSNYLILVLVRIIIFFIVSLLSLAFFFGNHNTTKQVFTNTKIENSNLEEKIVKLNSTLTEQKNIFKSEEYISYVNRVKKEAIIVAEKAATEKTAAEKLAVERAAAEKVIAEKLAAKVAVAEKVESEKADKIRGFTQTINNLDPIIKLIDDLQSGFFNSENWYNGNPVISNNVQSALNELESTDTTPLAAILIIRDNYNLAEKLAKLSMNINEINSDLTNMVRRSYFPPENSNWAGDIQKAKQLLSTAKGYVNQYRSIKDEIESGNIY